jgi:hypothetical protein
LSNCSAAFGFYAQDPAPHVQAVLSTLYRGPNSAIKRPKDECACANFAHTVVSSRHDLKIRPGREICVQTLHTMGVVLR